MGYVAGRGFLWSSLCVSLTYLAEYILVLVVCHEALTSVEEGLADTQAEAENKNDGSQLAKVLSCLFVLALIRFFVATADGWCSKRDSKITLVEAFVVPAAQQVQPAG